MIAGEFLNVSVSIGR